MVRCIDLTKVHVVIIAFDGAAVGNSFTGASTSLSRKSRKGIPDVHAFKLFHFLKSGLRFFNVVNTLEASDDSPRDSKGRLPKANRSVARGIIACLETKLRLKTPAIQMMALL